MIPRQTDTPNSHDFSLRGTLRSVNTTLYLSEKTMTTAIAFKSGSSLKSTIQLTTQALSGGRPGLNLDSTKLSVSGNSLSPSET